MFPERTSEEISGVPFDVEDVKDVLLQDLELSRAQIRASEEWHVKVSLIFTLSIAATSFAVLTGDPKRLLAIYPWLLVFIGLLVLAQLSLVLNYHFFYILLWGNYVELVERKINALFQQGNLLEFETRYSPLYFATKTSGLGFGGRVLRLSPNRIFIVMIHLPSVAMYAFCAKGVADHASSFYCAKFVYFLFAVPLLALALLYVYSLRMKTDVFETLEFGGKQGF